MLDIHQTRARRYWALLLGSFLLSLSLLGCSATIGADGCAEGTVDCNGRCISIENDDANCGACGTACQAGTFCNAGACETFCGAGQGDCGGMGLCVGLASDATNCGACGNTCPSAQFCDAGACSATCSGVLCPGAVSGSQECVHLDTDPDHCGQCGNDCAAGSECQAGVCVKACPEGRTLCGTECVDSKTSAQHCGVCGNACAAGVACVEGSCQDPGGCVGADCPCPQGQERCGSACIDTKTNGFHCGACDAACPSTQTCESGSCECPSGGLLCSGACVDAQTSNVNCGACGTTCTDGKTCQAGSCVCSDPGTTDCDGQCVDLDASTTNCGECGNACVGLETCDEGVCFYDVGDDCGGAAKNVSITKVALYQAVEANLFDAGATVPTNSRAVDIIQGKRAVVRVHLDVGSGFAARNLSARVYLDNGDVQPEAFFDKKQVSVDSTQGNFASTLNVTLPAEKIQADTKYYVELVECGDGATGAAGTTRIPASGTTNLEARKTGRITVAFLPIRYNNMVPDTSSAALLKYADEVKKQYGTTDVVTSVLPEYSQAFTGTPDLGGMLNSVVRAQRNTDRPAANVYYYGLVKSATNFNTFCGGGCTTGVAYVATNSPGFRAGIGIGFGDGQSTATFAHELGHNHGREHAPCGGVSSSDPNWPSSAPYSGGAIGKWGLDIGAAQLKDPAQYKDFMGYCGPNWISDYNYNAMTDEIASVNQIAGTRFVGKAEVWDTISVGSTGVSWSIPQEMTDFPLEHRVDAVVFDAQGNEILRVDAYQIDLSEGLGYLLVVPPRQSGWAAIGKSGDVALLYP